VPSSSSTYQKKCLRVPPRRGGRATSKGWACHLEGVHAKMTPLMERTWISPTGEVHVVADADLYQFCTARKLHYDNMVDHVNRPTSDQKNDGWRLVETRLEVRFGALPASSARFTRWHPLPHLDPRSWQGTPADRVLVSTLARGRRAAARGARLRIITRDSVGANR
jgi:hypothetical protein